MVSVLALGLGNKVSTSVLVISKTWWNGLCLFLCLAHNINKIEISWESKYIIHVMYPGGVNCLLLSVTLVDWHLWHMYEKTAKY